MNLHAIVSPIIGVVNPNEYVSVSISTGNAIAADGSQAPAYATPGSITASIGGTFTASIPDPVNNPTTLNVSAILTGSLQIGDAVSGTDGSGNTLPAGTSILAQLSGTAGGIGTYQLSAGGTLGSCTVTSASTALNVSAVASGTLQVGQTVSDMTSSLLTGTQITGQISGSQGAAGLYSVSQQQTVASETMTTLQILLGQIQPMPTGGLSHSDGLNTQAQSRVLYYNGAIDAMTRVALKGGDIVVRQRDNSVWLVTSNAENFYSSAGWSKVVLQLQNGS